MLKGAQTNTGRMVAREGSGCGGYNGNGDNHMVGLGNVPGCKPEGGKLETSVNPFVSKQAPQKLAST